jgi:hypothetical protein
LGIRTTQLEAYSFRLVYFRLFPTAASSTAFQNAWVTV